MAAINDGGSNAFLQKIAKGIGQGRSQTGHMVCAADNALLEGPEADVSLLTWHSHEQTAHAAQHVL